VTGTAAAAPSRPPTVVVPGREGRSSFQALQNAFEAGRDAQIVYYVFDAPFLSGHDLRRLPLTERRRIATFPDRLQLLAKKLRIRDRVVGQRLFTRGPLSVFRIENFALWHGIIVSWCSRFSELISVSVVKAKTTFLIYP
jgi:hypothetical protein